MSTDTAVHLAHCGQGEYQNTCKYGDDDCPALRTQPSPDLVTVPRAELEAIIQDLCAPLSTHAGRTRRLSALAKLEAYLKGKP